VLAALKTVGQVVGPVVYGLARIEAQRPENWPSVLSYLKALPLIADGFPVLWVPDSKTLDALLVARGRPERQGVLLARQGEVLSHTRSVLGEVRSPDLGHARALLLQAVDCVEHFPFPAQALALQVATVLAQQEAGVGSLSALAKEASAKTAALASAEHGAVIEDLGGSLMLLAVAPALVRFDPQRDALPTRPNRHAVAHVLDPAQYTPGNALESVLLAASVLRQAEASRHAAAARNGVLTTTSSRSAR